MTPTLLTIGHSTRTADDFLALLRAHGVTHLVDVRRWPRSRRHPQFNGTALAASLASVGIAYTHEEDLGGMRGDSDAARHAGLPKALRGYGAHMESTAFAAALERVRAMAARPVAEAGLERVRALGARPGADAVFDNRVAILCAEADPADCHRSLIADALQALGEDVRHIIDGQPPTRHTTTPGALVTEGRVSFPASQHRFDLS